MRAQIKEYFEHNGQVLPYGVVVDETDFDLLDILDWIEQGLAQALPDDDEPRGAVRSSEASLRSPEAFVDFCNKAAANGWGYVWGGRGKVYDEAERDYLYNTYHSDKYDHEYYYDTQWERWAYDNVADCSGLVEAFCGLNRTADGFYHSCVEKGEIDSFPNLPAYLVFRFSSPSGGMIHVGVCVGGDKDVESKDSATGVIKATLSARGWTHWGKPDFIDFSGSSNGCQPDFLLARLLKLETPNMSGGDVADVQLALIEHGFSVGDEGADGYYGEDSRNAARAFQSCNALDVDGIVGEDTCNALGGQWIGP